MAIAIALNHNNNAINFMMLLTLFSKQASNQPLSVRWLLSQALARLLPIFMLSILLTGCNNDYATRQLQGESTAAQKAATQGQLLFETKCDNCHGKDGQGLGKIRPLNRKWDLTDLVDKTQFHKPDISVDCDQNCSQKIAEFIIATFSPNSLFANKGKQVYDQQCAACHGVKGEGGSGGPLTTEFCRSCSDLETLAIRNDLTMPPADYTTCDRTAKTNFCADETAKYILAGFQEIDDQGNTFTPSNPTTPLTGPPPNTLNPTPATPPNTVVCTQKNSSKTTFEAATQKKVLIANEGKSQYFNFCASCHGDAGQGTQIWPPKITPDGGECTKVDCSNYEALTTYISQTMPTGSASENCTSSILTGECAKQTAAYMVSGFREITTEEALSTTNTEMPTPTTTAIPLNDQGLQTTCQPSTCEHWSVGFREVYDDILLPNCSICHSTIAQVFDNIGFKIYSDYNLDLEEFYRQSTLSAIGTSDPLLLAKPTNQVLHAGSILAPIFAQGSQKYLKIKAVFDRIKNNTCAKEISN